MSVFILFAAYVALFFICALVAHHQNTKRSERERQN